jgi:heat shock protein HslJ
MFRPALLFLLGFNLCSFTDETLTGYGAADSVWVLQSIDGQPFPTNTTITFPEEGKIIGEAPCNSYFGLQVAPYPWFEAKQIGSTKRACPNLDAEGPFQRSQRPP